jgi:hypothetical protein
MKQMNFDAYFKSKVGVISMWLSSPAKVTEKAVVYCCKAVEECWKQYNSLQNNSDIIVLCHVTDEMMLALNQMNNLLAWRFENGI